MHAALDQYLASRSHTAANTQINDRSVLQQFANAVGVDKYGQSKQLSYLTAHQVERYFIEQVGGSRTSPPATTTGPRPGGCSWPTARGTGG